MWQRTVTIKELFVFAQGSLGTCIVESQRV